MKKSKLLSYHTNGTFNFNIWSCLLSSKPASLFTHIKLNVYCNCCQFWLDSSNSLTEKCCVCLGVCNRDTDERRMMMRWQIWLFWTFWLKTQRCCVIGIHVCVRAHARRASTERGDAVIHMLSRDVGGGLCVFVNSCIFSLATQTWQALDQRTDRHKYSLSISQVWEQQTFASLG